MIIIILLDINVLILFFHISVSRLSVFCIRSENANKKEILKSKSTVILCFQLKQFKNNNKNN